MIRLWQRVGKVRAVAVLVLVAGLAGGLLIANRQTQHNATAEPVKAADAASLPRAGASSSAAPVSSDQASAQSKAQDAAAAAAAQAKAAEDAARKKKEEEASRSNTRSAGPPAYPAPASCAVYSGNRNIGCTELLAAGFGLDQMPCLDKLWTRESGWNPNAHNKSSGAHGIPQALPGSKMASYGANWETDARTQIKWGLNGYIKPRYKTPCGAWGHSQSTGWY
ncbi:lytic transglycosylase domain-containing protein [Dactylosporangium aurantiacum]|uniref:Lytic transglycosylase domain-containing protein n=1 Tax=Dactylosporangium aurantiacum TaxID=35754 RepID=A0A9Q9IPN7_9ACTN|nr:lytic transglycosylase domain-containing protein [Dactylosporangium aurantiacum]